MTDKVAVDLRVGMMDVSLCQLLTKDHRIIEFPSILLPDDVKAGSIITITCERDSKAESEDARAFEQTQRNILELYTREPKPLTLSVTSVTQTSVVLQWDKLYLGSADLRSLALYKNNEQLGLIPNALKRTSTKLSNLEIDKEYAFQLVLSTSAGVFKSNEVKAQTLKMTDLSGITACVGSLEGSAISMAELQATVDRIRCHELQDEVHLDTTHFICTEPEGKQYQKAQQLNIPIVRPDWLKACEEKRRLVNVHQYYLSADPRLMPPGRHRTASIATAVTNDADTSQRTISGGTSTTSVAEVPKVSVSAVDGGQRPAEGKSKSPAIDEEKAQSGEVAGPSDSKEQSPTETESEKAAESTTGSESKLPTGETSETTLKPNPESLETSKSPLSEGSEPSELEVDSNANKLQDEINPELINALQKDVKEVTAKAEKAHRDSEHQLEEEAAQAERELEASLAKHPERFEPAERADILEADEPDAENSTIIEEVRAAEIASSPEFEEQDLGAQDSDVETPQKAAQPEAEVEANVTEAEKLTDSKDAEEPKEHEHTQLEDPAETAQLEKESHAEGSEKESSESHENAQLEDPVKSAQTEKEGSAQAEQDSEGQPETQLEDPAKSAELESQKSEDAQPETQLEDPVKSAELESQKSEDAQPETQLEEPAKSAEIKSQESEDAKAHPDAQLEDPAKSAEIEHDSQATEPENAESQKTPETEGSEPLSEDKPEFITEDSDQEPVPQTPKKKKNKKKGKKK